MFVLLFPGRAGLSRLRNWPSRSCYPETRGKLRRTSIGSANLMAGAVRPRTEGEGTLLLPGSGERVAGRIHFVRLGRKARGAPGHAACGSATVSGGFALPRKVEQPDHEAPGAQALWRIRLGHLATVAAGGWRGSWHAVISCYRNSPRGLRRMSPLTSHAGW